MLRQGRLRGRYVYVFPHVYTSALVYYHKSQVYTFSSVRLHKCFGTFQICIGTFTHLFRFVCNGVSVCFQKAVGILTQMFWLVYKPVSECWWWGSLCRTSHMYLLRRIWGCAALPDLQQVVWQSVLKANFHIKIYLYKKCIAHIANKDKIRIVVYVFGLSKYSSYIIYCYSTCKPKQDTYSTRVNIISQKVHRLHDKLITISIKLKQSIRFHWRNQWRHVSDVAFGVL